MKRRPILLKKLSNESRRRLREVVGLIGTHAGTGVTYTGLMLSFYLGEELGKKTAFLECNNNRDMSLIQKAYEWSNEEEQSFCFRNITCFCSVSPAGIADILGGDYEYIIIDFGTDFKAAREEFLRCSIKIVIGGRSEWDIKKLLRFIDSYEPTRENSSWLYLIPQAGERTLQKIQKDSKKRILAVPCSEEPTRPNRSARLLFKELLRLV